MNYRLPPRLLLCVIAPLVILAGSCASNDSMPSLEEIQIDKLLDTIRDGAEPDEIRSCISARSYDKVEIVNERRLVFSRRGGGAWLNELRSPCPGLRRNDALVFNLRSSSICNLDKVSGIDSFAQTARAGATCTLGKFTKIPDWQVAKVEQFMDEL